MATLTEALKEAYASADPSVVILHTIELNHPDWASPIRLVQAFDDLQAYLESVYVPGVLHFPGHYIPGALVTFTACPFNFTLPQVGEGRQELQVTIDNVGLLLMSLLEAADLASPDPVTLTYRPYLSSDLSAPHMDPALVLDLQAVSVNVQQVVCTCAHANWLNRRFPGEIYTTAKFPGAAPRV